MEENTFWHKLNKSMSSKERAKFNEWRASLHAVSERNKDNVAFYMMNGNDSYPISQALKLHEMVCGIPIMIE